jgi:SAM-dependent methyltransferase
MNLKYIIPGIVRRFVPEQVLFAGMKLRGNGSRGEHEPARYFAEWQEHFKARGISLADRHILDVGSGRYARFALWMLAAGARRITLIDLYALPLDSAEHQELLKQDCTTLGLDLADMMTRIDIIQSDFTHLPIPAPEQQVDLVISSTALEHVHDPAQILAHCYAWLKPGGVTCHFVDLRDHNLSFRYPFEMLTFSDQVWGRWFNLRGGFHVNRWRTPEYLRAMDAVGFEAVSYERVGEDSAGLQKILPRLNARFQNITPDMLAILGIYLYGKKPHRASS